MRQERTVQDGPVPMLRRLGFILKARDPPNWECEEKICILELILAVSGGGKPGFRGVSAQLREASRPRWDQGDCMWEA